MGRVLKALLGVHFNVLKKVVMEREKGFLFSMIFLMPHYNGIKIMS